MGQSLSTERLDLTPVLSQYEFTNFLDRIFLRTSLEYA